VREENKARLDEVLARYEKRLAEMRRRQTLAHELHDVFIAAFEQILDGAIKPAMEDVGAALRAHGHDYELSPTQGYTDVRGRTHRTQLTMRVYPSGIPRSLFNSTSTPYVAFAADWLDRRVVVIESTLIPLGASKTPRGSGTWGKRGDYTLKQLTPHMIEREIVDVLTGVFGRDRMQGYRQDAADTAATAEGRERAG
jgi:hypothetical protein